MVSNAWVNIWPHEFFARIIYTFLILFVSFNKQLIEEFPYFITIFISSNDHYYAIKKSRISAKPLIVITMMWTKRALAKTDERPPVLFLKWKLYHDGLCMGCLKFKNIQMLIDFLNPFGNLLALKAIGAFLARSYRLNEQHHLAVKL